ncbi:MAG: hypothetical protein WC584_05045 [Candidatus Pacearchaeota archaeon]
MKNKNIARIFKNIEKGIKGNPFTRPLFDRDISLIVPDTSAIIDIQNMCRNYCGVEVAYQHPELFLESLEKENKRILIPEFLMDEINNHKFVRLNYYNREISQEFFDYLYKVYESGKGLLPKFRYGADSEQVGLDVYWASKFACENSIKKQIECFSDVDKELLKISFLLGTSKLELSTDKKTKDVGLVHLLSSDEHLIRGTEFLRDVAGYSNVNCINSRS